MRGMFFRQSQAPTKSMKFQWFSAKGGFRGGYRALLVLILLLGAAVQATYAKDYGEIERQRIAKVFPEVVAVSEPEGEFKVRTLSGEAGVLGYLFQSLDVVDIPAYSGKSINMQVILDTAGVIQDAYVLEHHEPILL